MLMLPHPKLPNGSHTHPNSHCRWYHPNIRGEDAVDLLLAKGTNGSYLVRPSQSHAGDYALSVR